MKELLEVCYSSPLLKARLASKAGQIAQGQVQTSFEHLKGQCSCAATLVLTTYRVKNFFFLCCSNSHTHSRLHLISNHSLDNGRQLLDPTPTSIFLWPSLLGWANPQPLLTRFVPQPPTGLSVCQCLSLLREDCSCSVLKECILIKHQGKLEYLANTFFLSLPE